MKNLRNNSILNFSFFIIALSFMCLQSCKKLEQVPLHKYQQTNLASDAAEYMPAHIDATLVDAWGMAVNPSGPIWIASNGSGKSQVYDKTGMQLIPPVSIPGAGKIMQGQPTGIVFNGTTDFMIPVVNTPSKFIYVGTDGVVSAWGGGPSASVVIDNSGKAVYTGLTVGNSGTTNYLYAANFMTGKIDMWDKDFNPVMKSFTDPNLPSGYSPFNIRFMNHHLYVTYAKLDPATHDETKEVGLGIVDVFSPEGNFVSRFASFGTLNAPWGLAESGTDGVDLNDAILVGNFGDGRINIFDALGSFKGQLMSKGMPLSIDGLWALETNVPGADPGQIFFTAGVDDESHGLFGYIMKQ